MKTIEELKGEISDIAKRQLGADFVSLSSDDAWEKMWELDDVRALLYELFGDLVQDVWHELCNEK